MSVLTGQASEPPSGSDESGEYWLVGETRVYKTNDGKAKGFASFVNKPADFVQDKSGVGYFAGQGLYIVAAFAVLGLPFGGQIADVLEANDAIGKPTVFSAL